MMGRQSQVLRSEQAGGGGALAACGDASWYCLRLRCAAGGRPGWVSSRSVHHQEHSRSSLSLSELQFIYTHRALKSRGGGRQGSHFWVGEAGALGEVSQWLHGS